MKPAGKECPDCREPMTDLRSLNARQCTNGKCQLLVDWYLHDKQKPLLGSNRVHRSNCA